MLFALKFFHGFGSNYAVLELVHFLPAEDDSTLFDGLY